MSETMSVIVVETQMWPYPQTLHNPAQKTDMLTNAITPRCRILRGSMASMNTALWYTQEVSVNSTSLTGVIFTKELTLNIEERKIHQVE